MKKNICTTLLITLCIVVGCTSKTKYVRDTSEGEVIEITLSEWETKMEDKDSFLVVFSQLYCNGCNQFHKMLDTYLPNHNINVYEVILDYESGMQLDNQDRINVYLSDFSQTPGVYYIEKGKRKEQLLPVDAIKEDEFDKFIETYQLDKVIE